MQNYSSQIILNIEFDNLVESFEILKLKRQIFFQQLVKATRNTKVSRKLLVALKTKERLLKQILAFGKLVHKSAKTFSNFLLSISNFTVICST